ncbi:phage tail tape measure protein [Levilactobacillus brevis]|uniref:phage tail tape measure protein n=1 Tax=Levilactobacillus brevis TaxID=1580 RepID=UPI000BE826A0|nr:phage tail tape measure protein [Levilactobacillus brevis]MCZ2120123.1 phage tail tape measure protein [Levilactobacillus brevis]MCZ2125657.1 phage tail tape measure protein [Levilactobacillus brevis]MCZ2209931.1 phage tail tape measure protein [Levilactobacillus brevis]MCZ2325403.1 phage tail tape measure protein [Levilactobacillus brevis]
MAIKHTTIDIDWKVDDSGLRSAEGSVKTLETATKSATTASASFSASQRASAAAQRESTSAAKSYTEAQRNSGRQDRESAQDRAKLKEQVKEYETALKSSQRTIELTKKADASYTEMLKAQGHAHAANSDHIRSLRGTYVSLQTQYSKEVTQLQRVKTASGSTSEAYQAQRKRVNDLGLQMAKTSNELNGFNRAQKSMKTVSESANRVYDKTKALSLGIGAAFVYGAKKAIELQHEYKVTNNLLTTGGESARTSLKATKQMQADGAKYSIQYGKSQKSIAEGYQELTKRGYTSEQSLGSMQALLKASVASGDSFSDVVHDSTAALESFGMRANSTAGMIKNTKTVTNQMAYAADLTATDFHSMGIALSYSGVSAKQAGLSLSETASAIGILSNNGLEADKAGTGLRKTLTSLQSPSKAAQGALDKLGLSTKDFTKKNGDMKSMADTFSLIQKHSAKLGATEKASVFHNLFGATGQQAGAILAENADQLGKLNEKVKDSAKNDYTGKLSAKNMQSAQNQINKFKQAASGLAITFAQTVLPSITKLAIGMGGLLEKFGKLDKSQKTMLTWTAITVAALAPAAKVVSVITTLGSAAIKTAKLIKGLAVSQDALAASSTALAESEGAASAATTGASAGGGLLSKGKSLAGGFVKGGLVAGGVTIIAQNLPTAIAGQSKGMSEAAKGRGISKDTKKQFLGGIGTDEWIGNKLGSAWKWANTTQQPAGSKPSKKSAKNPYKKFPQYAKKAISDVGKTFNEGEGRLIRATDANSKSVSKSLLSENAKTYNGLKKQVTNYGDTRIKESKRSLDVLVKNGSLTKKQEKSILDSEQKSNSKREASAKKAISEVTKSEANGGKGRQKAVANANAKIASLMSQGNAKQKVILGKLSDSTKKLSAKQGTAVVQSSYKAMRSTIKNANTTYTKSKSAAYKKYKAVMSAADHERYVTGTLSKKQYEAIKKKAEKTRDKSVGAAKDRRDKTVAAAQDEHEKVVREARAQTKGHLKQVDQETGQAVGLFQSMVNKINSILTGIKWPDMDHLTSNEIDKVSKSTAKSAVAQNKTLRNMDAGKKHPAATKSKATFRTAPKLNTGFAVGGSIRKTGMAMVGENGSEVLQRGKQFSVVGAKGAQLLQVRSGDRIYNHADVTKMAHGAFSQRLPNFAAGTTQLASFAAGSGAAMPGLSKKTSKDSILESKKMSKSVTKNYGDMSKKSASSLKQLNKKNASLWHDTRTDAESETTKLHKRAVKKFNDVKDDTVTSLKSMHKQFNSVTTDLVSDFGSIFGKLKGQAHDGMAGAISSMNSGISSIDTTLAQFGGNKSVLKPIHYATGSKGPIASDQLAVLNDATSGPRQELVARGSQLLKPIGKDVITPLKKGDEVFNGSQVEKAKPYLPHFKKGTGASDDKLISLASKNHKNPDAAWKRDFDGKTANPKGSDLQRGLTTTAKGATDSVGPNWYKAGWNVINDAINGGSGAGGNWAHSPGSGWSTGGNGQKFGDSRDGGSHDGVDFGAALGTPFHAMHGGVVTRAGNPVWAPGALGKVITVKSDDGYQEIYQEFGGMRNIKVSVGDKVKTGQTLGTLGPLNGAGSGAHLHVGVSHGSLWDHGGTSTRGWYDVTKMHGKSSGVEKSKPKDTGVEKLFKQEIGKSALSWISKRLHVDDDSGSGGTSAAPSGSHKHWLEQAGIPKSWFNSISEIIDAESGWRVNASNGQYQGIPQTTVANLRAAGSDWRTNPITQLKAMKKYISGRYGNANKALAFRRVHNWYAKGGRPKVGEWSIVGEKGPELFKPDSAGTIYPHEKSKQIAKQAIPSNSRHSSKPKIDFHPTIHVNITGDASGNITKQQVMKWVKEAMGESFEQLQDLLGGV